MNDAEAGSALGFGRPSSRAFNATIEGPDGQLLGPISGEGVFKPQAIDNQASVIVGDNRFKPSPGGDSLTGEDRPMSVWTNGSWRTGAWTLGPALKIE